MVEQWAKVRAVEVIMEVEVEVTVEEEVEVEVEEEVEVEVVGVVETVECLEVRKVVEQVVVEKVVGLKLWVV